MDPLALLAYLGATAVVSGLFYLVATRRSREELRQMAGSRLRRAPLYLVASKDPRPIYSDDPQLKSGPLFKIAALSATSAGLILSFFQSLSAGGLDLLGLSTVTLGSMVVFLLVVSIYTDHRHRMVDRVMLHWGLGIALVLGVLRLIEIQSEPLTVIYVVSILLSFAVIFAPSIGASDSRAFMILFAAGIPMLGLEVTWYVFLVGIALWLGYGIVAAIQSRNFKVSIPLVPYIFLPLAIAPLVLTVGYGVPRLIEILS